MSGLNEGDTVTIKKITDQSQFAAQFTGKVKSITKKASSDGPIEEIVVEDNNGNVTLIYSVDEEDYYAVNSTIPKISAPNEYTLVKKSKSGGKKRTRRRRRKKRTRRRRKRGGWERVQAGVDEPCVDNGACKKGLQCILGPTNVINARGTCKDLNVNEGGTRGKSRRKSRGKSRRRMRGKRKGKSRRKRKR